MILGRMVMLRGVCTFMPGRCGYIYAAVADVKSADQQLDATSHIVQQQPESNYMLAAVAGVDAGPLGAGWSENWACPMMFLFQSAMVQDNCIYQHYS